MGRGRVLVRPETVVLPSGDITAVEWTETKSAVNTAAVQAELAASRVFDVRTYGAVGDGVADDTQALQDCADACLAAKGTFYIPAQMTCAITTPVDLWGINNVQIEGVIWDDTHVSPAIVAGSDADSLTPSNIYINSVQRPGGRTNTSIRLQGLMNADIKIMQCYKLQLWADPAESATRALAYNRFLLGNVYILELNCAAYPGWVNENNFYAGRVQQLYILGPYHHNHNKFYFSMEYATIVIEEGDNNIIESRFEGSATITLGANTFLNRIIQTWSGSSTGGATTHFTITDNGVRNRITTLEQTQATWRSFWRIDPNTPTTDTTRNTSMNSTDGQLLPGFRKLCVGNNWGWVADTGVVPIEGMQTIEFSSDETIWRLYVEVYNQFGTKLTDGGTNTYLENIGGIWSWVAADNLYYTSFVSKDRSLRFIHPDVAYIRIRVRFDGGSSGTWFRYAELGALQPTGERDYGIVEAHRNALRPLAQPTETMPTKSLVQRGTIITTPIGIYTMTARSDTEMAANATTGATSITVASAVGMTTGDQIAICLTNYNTHFTTISAISGTTITIATGLPSPAGTGREVATQRWKYIT